MKIEPIIKNIENEIIVGLEYYGKNEKEEISKMWDLFNKKCLAIPHLSNNKGAYGVCFSDPDYSVTKKFRYIAGLPVQKVDALPREMVSCIVPAGKYAVFTHCGPVSKLGETFGYIHEMWLPASKYNLDITRPDFEYYDERFTIGEDPKSKFDIYIPIIEKDSI